MTTKADLTAADRILKAAIRHSIAALRDGADHTAIIRTLEVGGEAAEMLMGDEAA